MRKESEILLTLEKVVVSQDHGGTVARKTRDSGPCGGV